MKISHTTHSPYDRDDQADTKSLSIIIPVYNEETGIAACLDAIAAQTVAPDEVIVVDNNSTDRTLEIARRYGFVRIIHERRQGVYFAHNTGMDSAKGDILARIDADTLVGPGWAAAIVGAFADGSVQAASGSVGYHDMPFVEFGRYVQDGCLRVARAGGYRFLWATNMAITRRAWRLVRRELCHQSFLFEDNDIALHLRQHGIQPAYLRDMRVDISARRLADRPRDFRRYIAGHSRTWRHHGKRLAPGVRFAEVAFTLTYIGLKPLHMSYDAELRRLSLAKILRTNQTRPNPMGLEP